MKQQLHFISHKMEIKKIGRYTFFFSLSLSGSCKQFLVFNGIEMMLEDFSRLLKESEELFKQIAILSIITFGMRLRKSPSRVS